MTLWVRASDGWVLIVRLSTGGNEKGPLTSVSAGQRPDRLSQHRARPKGFEPLTF